MMIDEMTPLCKMLLEKMFFFFVLVEEVKNIKTVLE